MSLRDAVAAAFLLFSTIASNAGEVVPYTAQAFEAAQSAGKPIVVHVTATWCPTCHAQIPIVQSLADDPANSDLIVFNVDFDTQGDVLRQFGVRYQSTLIAFQGTAEKTRSIGQTSPDDIAALVAQTR